MRKNAPRTNPFHDTQAISPQAADIAILGGEVENDLSHSGRMVAKPIDILSIHPDPAQPRRVLPVAVREVWQNTPLAMKGAFELWCEMLGLETRQIGTLIKAYDETEHDNDLYGLIKLASSIYHDGLINPVTIAAQGGGYVIETGERRWLAHCLLHIYSDRDFSKIPARVVPKLDIWRQAAENNARENLTAIGKARQMALLLMDMYSHTEQFTSYNAMLYNGCDRRFYAQVANLRVLRGMGGKVETAMGIGLRQCGNYRALLQLFKPDEVPPGSDYRAINDTIWQMADSDNWTLDDILAYREMTLTEWQIDKKDNGIQIPLSETPGTDSDETLSESQDSIEVGDEQSDTLTPPKSTNRTLSIPPAKADRDMIRAGSLREGDPDDESDLIPQTYATKWNYSATFDTLMRLSELVGDETGRAAAYQLKHLAFDAEVSRDDLWERYQAIIGMLKRAEGQVIDFCKRVLEDTQDG